MRKNRETRGTPSARRHGAAEASYADAPPHCYKVAEAALMSLVGAGIGGEAGGNQSVLISGESGAGKTEATKHCLSFLAEVAGSDSAVEHLGRSRKRMRQLRARARSAAPEGGGRQ